MFKRRIALLFGLTVIAGGLFLIVRGPAGSEDGSRDQVNVRLKWLHQAQFAGFYAAEGMGFYEEAGLDVQLNPGGVDFQAIQMVAAGGEQFGVTGADQLLMARERDTRSSSSGYLPKEPDGLVCAERKRHFGSCRP